MVSSTSRRRLLLAAAPALLCAALASTSPALSAVQPATAWGVATNDVTPDPAIRYGRLANGMKYAIVRNEVPDGAAAVRLHFDFGSIGEAENERGLAHFIEHMAFNGSTRVPEGEMTKILERQGLKFGPDTNAVTGFDLTMYMLDLPKADAPRLDTAFMLMREVASEISFNEGAIDRERGVILGERRSREDHNLKRITDVLEFSTPQTVYSKRLPIGTPEVLNSAKAATFRSLYQRYYRPENATFIFVGDADPADIEARIRKSFADWKPVGPAGAELPRGRVDLKRGAAFDTFVDPAVPSIVSLSVYRPWEDQPDTVAERRREIMRQLAAGMLNRRIQRLANAPNSVLLGGGMGTDEVKDAALATSLNMITKDGQWKAGLDAGEQELRRAQKFGFSKAELDVELAGLRGRFKTAAEQANARTHAQIAQAIAQSINGNDVITSPAWDYAFVEAEAGKIKIDEVNAEFRRLWTGSAPLVHVSAKEPITPAQVAAAYGASTKLAVTAPVAEVTKAFAYESFGAPGKVVSDTRIADLGLRTIGFANNVRLNIKKTDFEPGKVNFAVRMAGGQLLMPRDKPGLAVMASSISALAGTRQHNLEELKTITSGRQVIPGAVVTENAFVSQGVTTVDDLGLQMKLSAAYLTDPGYRPEAQTQWETVVGLFMKQIAAQPMPLLETRLPHLLTDSDGRFGIPPEDALAARSLNEFKAVYGKVAPTAPIEITIVGDVDEAAAIAAVAQSFGALPPRAVLAAPARGEVAWRSKTDPIFLTHSGPADQTVVGSAWRTDDDADFRTAYGLTMLDNALTLLLTESVRERLGASYGASVSSVSSSSFTDHGYLLANAVVDPGKADSVDAAIAEAAKELRDKPLDKDMLERARNPEVEKARRELRQNDYWLSALNEAQSRPDRLDRPRQRIAFLESITAADLQKLARTYLTPERMVRVRVSSDKAPGASAPAAKSPGAKSPGAGAKGERGW